MSRSIHWYPTPGQRSLGITHSHGSIIDQLEKVFGDMPITLRVEHLDKLRVMKALWTLNDNPYSTIMDLIIELDSIVLDFST